MRKASIIRLLLVAMAVMQSLPTYALAGQAAWREREAASIDAPVKQDLSEEVNFGREVAARILGRYGLYENAELSKYVNLVGHALAMNANRPEIEFRFAVLNTDEINGYAAPGGYIFVTRGAIQKMQDESELAGVLAHEIGHVVEKHVVRELNIRATDSSGAAGLALLIGGTSESARLAFAQAVDKALDMLFKNGFKREDEVQADKDAVLFSALSGYDPAGLQHYFERLAIVKGKHTEVLDRTHPGYDSRIAVIKETISSEGISGVELKIKKERFTEIVKTVN